jgi:hypothetical protein
MKHLDNFKIFEAGVKTILGRIFSKHENITLSEEKINNSRNIILKLL